MTEAGRLSGVFFEPGKVFADVAERPRWIAPILVSILIGIAFVAVISTHIGWDQIIRQSFAASSRTADLPADQREKMIVTGAKVASVLGWAGAIFGTPLFVLIVAGILTGLFNGLLGTELKFAQTFAITAYAVLVRTLFSLLMILLAFLKPPEDFNLQVSPFSPAAYMSRLDTPKWLYSLLGSLDLFTIWVIVLLALGFSVAARKISFSKSLTAILIPWLLVVVAQMTYASFM